MQLRANRTDKALRVDLVHAFESLPAHYLERVLMRDFEELTITGRLGELTCAVKSGLVLAHDSARIHAVSRSAHQIMSILKFGMSERVRTYWL